MWYELRLVNLTPSRGSRCTQRSCLFFFSPKLLKLQERVLNNVVISLLGDEDPRVRHVAAASLTRYLPSVCPLRHSFCFKRCYFRGGERPWGRSPHPSRA